MKKLLAIVLLLCSVNLAAQTYPTHTVKIIVGLPAGSGPDVVIRKIAEQLSKKWSVSVVVDNRPGGGGAVSLTAFNQEPADGYTLYFGDTGAVIGYPILYRDSRIVENLQPVRPVFNTEMMLITSSKNQNAKELETALKVKPIFASWGVGSSAHLNELIMADYYGIKPIHIPYKEYGPWFIDTANQQVTAGFATMASSGNMQKAGRLRYIAVTGDRRDFAYPDVPTVKELTGKNIKTISSFLSLYVNKQTDPVIQKKIVKDLEDVVYSNETKATLLAIDYRPWTISLDEFKLFYNEQYNLYKRLVTQYNISIN
jgi:tripartite-type tricarboxylate transporter receptor subunit TctC